MLKIQHDQPRLWVIGFRPAASRVKFALWGDGNAAANGRRTLNGVGKDIFALYPKFALIMLLRSDLGSH